MGNTWSYGDGVNGVFVAPHSTEMDCSGLYWLMPVFQYNQTRDFQRFSATFYFPFFMAGDFHRMSVYLLRIIRWNKKWCSSSAHVPSILPKKSIHFFPASKINQALPLPPPKKKSYQDGFWEVAVKAVRLGNRTLDHCANGCRGIIDTGASRWSWGESCGHPWGGFGWDFFSPWRGWECRKRTLTSWRMPCDLAKTTPKKKRKKNIGCFFFWVVKDIYPFLRGVNGGVFLIGFESKIRIHPEVEVRQKTGWLSKYDINEESMNPQVYYIDLWKYTCNCMDLRFLNQIGETSMAISVFEIND